MHGVSGSGPGDLDAVSRDPNGASDHRNVRKWVQLLVVLLPVGVQVGLIVLSYRDWIPVWASYPDPGYNYLLAGASLVSGGAPALVYHPGSSFQLLVGLLERLTFWVSGEQTFFVDVVSRPEFYAQAVGVGVAALYVLSLCAVAWRMLIAWGWLPSLVFQLMILWGLPVIASARYHLWPESLVLSSSLLVVALLAPLMTGRTYRPSAGVAALLGAVCAIGVSSKVVFAPLIVLAILVLPVRRLWIFVVSFTAMLVAVVLPLGSRAIFMWNWFSGVTLSTGRHGGASQSSAVDNFVVGHTVLSGFLRWYWLIIVILLVGTTVVTVLQYRSKTIPVRSSVALVVALGATAALALKESQPRDLIAMVPIMATAVAYLVFRLDSYRKTGSFFLPLAAVVVGLFSFLALHGVVHQHNFAKDMQSRIDRVVEDAPRVQELVDSGAWGLGYNVWTPGNALMFGSNDAVMFGVEFSDNLLDEEIGDVYQDPLYFDVWSSQLQRISDASRLSVMSCDEVKSLVDGRNGSVGVVVESESHVRLDASGTRLLLSGGEAEFTGPEQVGGYHAYRILSLDCSPTGAS